MRDFVRGAVAAEMPMTYPDEALRAQAVAAHSYALAVKAQADPDNEALKGAYFSANPTQRLGYITDTVMRAMWGEDYEANRTRLYTVVDSVLDEILLYRRRALQGYGCACGAAAAQRVLHHNLDGEASV